jgi:hypothetical protein
MRVVRKFVLEQDRVDATTNEVDFMAVETLLEVTHYCTAGARRQDGRGCATRWGADAGGRGARLRLVEDGDRMIITR